MGRPVTEGVDLPPIRAVAVGASDEVVVRVPVRARSEADGKSLGSLRPETETGFYPLAIRPDRQYLSRPRAAVRLKVGDAHTATATHHGRALSAASAGITRAAEPRTG